MAYVGRYAIDGSWNVRTVTGASYVGLFNADGCINVIASAGQAPLTHPCGAYRITTSPGTLVPRGAPDGSIYVNSVGASDGSQKVTFV